MFLYLFGIFLLFVLMSRFVFEIVACLFFVAFYSSDAKNKKCPNLLVTYKVVTKFANFSKSRRPSKWGSPHAEL